MLEKSQELEKGLDNDANLENKENPLDKTVETYKQNFNKYVERTRVEPSNEFKEQIDLFLSNIPKGGIILEIGSASGRDARYFSDKGYKVFCTDIVPEALEKLSNEGFETSEFDFRDNPKQEWNKKFDGFFANAVLLHASADIFEKALENISVVLKDNGVAAFSLKVGNGEEITLEKMDAPRYFHYHTEQEIRDILSKMPFEIINISCVDNNKWLWVLIRAKN